MKTLLLVAAWAACFAMTGCASRGQRLGGVAPGMSRFEVVSGVGHPKYVASAAGDEYLWYDVQRVFGSTHPHYVKLVNGLVESHGSPEEYPDAPAFSPAP